MQFAKPSLLALGVCGALAAPASAAGWKPGLQQKTCATLEWRPNGTASSLLRVYNTDGTTLDFLGYGSPQTLGGPDVLTQPQALITAACSPNVKAPHGHNYWASVYNPNAPTPLATRLIVNYPPSDTPPVFVNPPPKGLWTTGMQTKTCAAIEWGSGIVGAVALLLHNTDGSQLQLPATLWQLPRPVGSFGPITAFPIVNALQAAAIEACGPNADVSHEGRHYRASVKDPTSTTPYPTRLLFRPPQQ